MIGVETKRRRAMHGERRRRRRRLPAATRRRCAPGRVTAASADRVSATGESLRPDAQDEGGEHDDGHPAEHRADKVLTSTCAPPSTRQATARLAKRGARTPCTSMKAFTSQGTPMLGSTLESGVISAPASAAAPQPSAKVTRRTRPAVDAEAAREVLVHDHGAGREAEPRAARAAPCMASAQRTTAERSAGAGSAE